MNTSRDEARLALQKARAALRNGQLNQARQWAEQAAALAPQMEDPWLVLAAVASPRASLEYVQRALKINPESDLARRAMEWAMERLRQPDRLSPAPTSAPTAVPGKVPNGAEVPAAEPAAGQPRGPRRARPKPVLAAILLGLGCIVFAAAAWSTGLMPVVASIIQQTLILYAPTQPPLWAPVTIPKPTYTPQGPSSQGFVGLAAAAPPKVLQLSAKHPLNLAIPVPADQLAETAGVLPTAASESDAFMPTAEPPWSGSLSMETLPDTPTAEIPAYASAPTGDAAGAVVNDGEHWIDVNLTQQTVKAYTGDTVVNSFLASTGALLTPTATGMYHIYIKLLLSDMSGPDYFLPDVPYVMFFYKDYGLHGTYWHNSFGTPVSHGCVNLSIPDAEWLYGFSSVGTLVDIHY